MKPAMQNHFSAFQWYCYPLFPYVNMHALLYILFYYGRLDFSKLYNYFPDYSISTSTAGQGVYTFPPQYAGLPHVTSFVQWGVKRHRQRLEMCSGSWAWPVFPLPQPQEELSLGSFCSFRLNPEGTTWKRPETAPRLHPHPHPHHQSPVSLGIEK